MGLKAFGYGDREKHQPQRCRIAHLLVGWVGRKVCRISEETERFSRKRRLPFFFRLDASALRVLHVRAYW